MLNKVEDVSVSDALLKQGGEHKEKQPMQKPSKPIDEYEQKLKTKQKKTLKIRMEMKLLDLKAKRK